MVGAHHRVKREDQKEEGVAFFSRREENRTLGFILAVGLALTI